MTVVTGEVYVRPQWTGDTKAGNSQCPSCLSYHAASYVGCNGKREPCAKQCTAFLGEIRCHRPANHIEEHQALSSVFRVAWSVLSQFAPTAAPADDANPQQSDGYPANE